MASRGWSFTTPYSITGMRGSCVIIPCRFTYSISQPADLQVIWYLFESNGYPLVFDERKNVISRYRGITSLIGSVKERNCSLKIEKLEMLHNQDRLYPWVDKSPITSYHSLGHTFYDKSSQLIVLGKYLDMFIPLFSHFNTISTICSSTNIITVFCVIDHAMEPQLNVIGIPRVGEQSRVSCIVRHTCILAPPTLAINGIPGVDSTTDTQESDGVWERKVERTWTVKELDQSVSCTVRYRGGQTATRDLRLNVECKQCVRSCVTRIKIRVSIEATLSHFCTGPYDEITMIEPPSEATEGVANSVICSVSYKCQKNVPAIVWNYEDMQSSFYTKKNSTVNAYIAVSNLTFIGSLEDDGKSLTCTAKFMTGQTSASATLHVKSE